MSVPQRYRAPLHRYESQHERASLHGFQRTEFFETTSGEAFFMAPQLGIYAAGGGGKGEYREVSDAYLARWFLEDTRCIEVIDERGPSALRVEGTSSATPGYGALGFLTVAFVALTLTGLFGIPFAKYARGEAVLRIYEDGRLVDSVASSELLRYGTTIYTEERDEARSVALARGMALRSAADKAAAVLCHQ